MEDLLDPRDVSRILGISEASLTQMRYRGTGPAFLKVNARTVRYRRTDVESWLVSRLECGGGPA